MLCSDINPLDLRYICDAIYLRCDMYYVHENEGFISYRICKANISQSVNCRLYRILCKQNISPNIIKNKGYKNSPKGKLVVFFIKKCNFISENNLIVFTILFRFEKEHDEYLKLIYVAKFRCKVFWLPDKI